MNTPTYEIGDFKYTIDPIKKGFLVSTTYYGTYFLADTIFMDRPEAEHLFPPTDDELETIRQETADNIARSLQFMTDKVLEDA